MRSYDNSAWPLILVLAGLFCVSTLPAGSMHGSSERDFPAPEFTHGKRAEWINSGPLSIRDLGGKVVLLDFWTFDCWNCYRSIDWLHSVEERFAGDAFTVIGIHTPEFQHERNRQRVREKVKEYGLTHPVMIDNDFSYWGAMGTRYWPTFYLIDKRGQVRAAFMGEVHRKDAQALKIETKIGELLAE